MKYSFICMDCKHKHHSYHEQCLRCGGALEDYTQTKVVGNICIGLYCPSCERRINHSIFVYNKFPYESNCRCGAIFIVNKPQNLNEILQLLKGKSK